MFFSFVACRSKYYVRFTLPEYFFSVWSSELDVSATSYHTRLAEMCKSCLHFKSLSAVVKNNIK